MFKWIKTLVRYSDYTERFVSSIPGYNRGDAKILVTGFKVKKLRHLEEAW